MEVLLQMVEALNGIWPTGGALIALILAFALILVIKMD